MNTSNALGPLGPGSGVTRYLSQHDATGGTTGAGQGLESGLEAAAAATGVEPKRAAAALADAFVGDYKEAAKAIEHRVGQGLTTHHASNLAAAAEGDVDRVVELVLPYLSEWSSTEVHDHVMAHLREPDVAKAADQIRSEVRTWTGPGGTKQSLSLLQARYLAAAAQEAKVDVGAVVELVRQCCEGRSKTDVYNQVREELLGKR